MTPLEQVRDRLLRTNLEAIVTFPAGLGLTTATPLQRAICRIATGRPLAELAEHPDVLEAVGRVDLLWGEQPDELVVLGPSRTGKSTIVAGLAIRATQTVDLSAAGDVPGELPRYPIISVDRDKAGAIYGVIRNALRGPYQHLATRDPTGGRAVLRHPSGREVEIVVSAGRAGGEAVISRWLIGLALDEAARMQGSDKQVNLPDTLAAARDRMLPGAQIAMLSSKWAPWGPVYDLCQEHGGRPSRAKSVVVVGHHGAAAETLNPVYWTPQRLAALRLKDPSAYKVARNEWQAPGQNMFALDYLQRLTKPAVRCDCDARQRSGLPSATGEPACPHNDSPPHPRQHYVAIIDPATRGNAWALVVLTVREIAEREAHGSDGHHIFGNRESNELGDSKTGREAGERGGRGQDPGRRSAPAGAQKGGGVSGYRDDVALVRQWQGSPTAPLDSDDIFKQIAELLRPYRCSRVWTDPWSADALRTVARQHGLYLIEVTSPDGKALRMADKVESFDSIKSALAMHERGHHDHRSLELHPCPALLADLSRVVRRPTQTGVVVELPLTSDGRHCDYAAALALGYTQVLQRPSAVSVHETTDERDERQEREHLQRRAEEQERVQQGDSWQGQSYEGVTYE